MFKDTDDNQYWLLVSTLAATTLMVLATILSISAYTEDNIIKELLSEGKDPLELACVYNLSRYNESACALLVQGRIANDTP